jgi:hypothetical protein
MPSRMPALVMTHPIGYRPSSNAAIDFRSRT